MPTPPEAEDSVGRVEGEESGSGARSRKVAVRPSKALMSALAFASMEVLGTIMDDWGGRVNVSVGERDDRTELTL